MKMGCSERDSLIIADVFLAAELRGHSSHGMLRIRDYYELWKSGRINTAPAVRIVHESPSTAVVDGDNSVGMIAARRSMEIAIEKAEKAGTGWVATRNSNHFGIAGYYAMMALEYDMIGICLTNANPLVAPTFSISRMMGTNPIAVAIPAMKTASICSRFCNDSYCQGQTGGLRKKSGKGAFWIRPGQIRSALRRSGYSQIWRVDADTGRRQGAWQP